MIILDFEKGIFELESKIKELESLDSDDIKLTDEIKKLKQKHTKILNEVFSNLTPYQKLQIARHPDRPQTQDYIDALITDFVPLAGDRLFKEDKAIIAGIGMFEGKGVAIIGHQKGREPKDKVEHNFGMPNPEGYRKAMRIMDMANKFEMPVITFIDTVGAFPGIDAEERGQAEAIAKCLENSFSLDVPVISIVIGEGGSGGAVAIGVSNYMMMLEYSVYSVISPEGCASILWKDPSFVSDAANALRITSDDLKKLGIIDKITKEPVGGAHRDYKKAVNLVSIDLKHALSEMNKIPDLKKHREERFLNISRISK